MWYLPVRWGESGTRLCAHVQGKEQDVRCSQRNECIQTSVRMPRAFSQGRLFASVLMPAQSQLHLRMRLCVPARHFQNAMQHLCRFRLRCCCTSTQCSADTWYGVLVLEQRARQGCASPGSDGVAHTYRRSNAPKRGFSRVVLCSIKAGCQPERKRGGGFTFDREVREHVLHDRGLRQRRAEDLPGRTTPTMHGVSRCQRESTCISTFHDPVSLHCQRSLNPQTNKRLLRRYSDREYSGVIK